MRSTQLDDNQSLEIDFIPRMSFPPRKSTLIRKIITDVACIILLSVPILCFWIWGVPYERGFNCDDESIRYPYRDNTIPSSVLFAYSLLIPIFTICINEFVIIKTKFATHPNQTVLPLIQCLKCYCWNVYFQLVPLLFAAASSQLLTDIAKYSIGRLRPHFIDLCRPILPSGEVIYRDSQCLNPHQYVIGFRCSNRNFDDKRIRDGRLSFMSGHSSFSAVCLIYLVFYIQMRVRWSIVGLARPLSQMLLICLVLYTGLSRISDYKHHWSDVLTGLIQGTLVATLTTFFVSDLYQSRNSYQTNNKLSQSQHPIDPESGV